VQQVLITNLGETLLFFGELTEINSK